MDMRCLLFLRNHATLHSETSFSRPMLTGALGVEWDLREWPKKNMFLSVNFSYFWRPAQARTNAAIARIKKGGHRARFRERSPGLRTIRLGGSSERAVSWEG